MDTPMVKWKVESGKWKMKVCDEKSLLTDLIPDCRQAGPSPFSFFVFKIILVHVAYFYSEVQEKGSSVLIKAKKPLS